MPMTRSADTPYEAKADFLPRTLEEALQHLKVNKALRDGFGNASSTTTAASRKPRSPASTWK
jgi:glutamine synthetase